jgi:hypothetical protein
MEEKQSYTAFYGERQIASGPLAELLRLVKEWVAKNGEAGVLYFDDRTGRQVDFNLREAAPAGPGPGRPKLGVVSREISLLPRHWDWLQQQPNGASAALRRLVDQARNSTRDQERRAREATGRFLMAVAGNYPGYEEATRALYAGDQERMESLMSEWPSDVRQYAARLFAGEAQPVA